MSGKDKFYLAVLILLLAAGFFQFTTGVRLDRENRELKVLLESNLEANTRHRQLRGDIALLQDQVNGIRTELDNYLASRDGLNESAAGEPDAALRRGVGGSPAGLQEERDDKSLRDLHDERMQTPEAMDLLARNSVQQQYGDFIRSLNLRPEEEEELFQLMVDEMKKRLFLSERLASGELTRDEYARLRDPRSLYSALREYLTEEEMEAFDRHQADAPVRAHASVEANQYVLLSNGAPGLTDASRALAATVLADVMTNRQTQYLMQNAEGMAELFQMAEMQLEGTLDAEQMKIVSDFLERQVELRELWEQ